MESDLYLGYVLEGAGPDDSHLASDGFTRGLAGGLMIGPILYYTVWFSNEQVWRLTGTSTSVSWFLRWSYWSNRTRKWYIDNVNPG